MIYTYRIHIRITVQRLGRRLQVEASDDLCRVLFALASAGAGAGRPGAASEWSGKVFIFGWTQM